MDCNSYSYAPTMADDDTILKQFENDDMYMSLTKDRHYSNYIYYVSANSYDGQLKVEEVFKSKETAEALYNYIYESFTNTPPTDGEIETYIKTLKAC